MLCGHVTCHVACHVSHVLRSCCMVMCFCAPLFLFVFLSCIKLARQTKLFYHVFKHLRTTWLYLFWGLSATATRYASIEIDGYKIYRLDSISKVGAGVCDCIKSTFRT